MNYMKIKYEKYINPTGQVAVLYSPEYGSGWSGMARDPDMAQAMLFDSRIVFEVLGKPPSETWATRDDENYQEKISKWVKELEIKMHGWGYSGIHLGGAKDLAIKWMEKGSVFRIQCDDGYENILELVIPEHYIT